MKHCKSCHTKTEKRRKKPNGIAKSPSQIPENHGLKILGIKHPENPK